MTECPHCGLTEKHNRRVCWMRKFNADPEFAAERNKRGAERLKALHADPEFRAAHIARTKAMHADPEFAAARDKRASNVMKALHADPEFAAAHAKRASERMKKIYHNHRLATMGSDLEKGPAAGGAAGGGQRPGQGLSDLRDGTANLHHDQTKKPDQKAVLLGDGVLEQGL